MLANAIEGNFVPSTFIRKPTDVISWFSSNLFVDESMTYLKWNNKNLKVIIRIKWLDQNKNYCHCF